MVFVAQREKSSPRDGFTPAPGAMRKTARFVSCVDKEAA
jgi:hypothetical protein